MTWPYSVYLRVDILYHSIHFSTNTMLASLVGVYFAGAQLALAVDICNSKFRIWVPREGEKPTLDVVVREKAGSISGWREYLTEPMTPTHRQTGTVYWPFHEQKEREFLLIHNPTGADVETLDTADVNKTHETAQVRTSPRHPCRKLTYAVHFKVERGDATAMRCRWR
jgi:hypothetical protein